jgi:hypothetical protein
MTKGRHARPRPTPINTSGPGTISNMSPKLKQRGRLFNSGLSQARFYIRPYLLILVLCLSAGFVIVKTYKNHSFRISSEMDSANVETIQGNEWITFWTGNDQANSLLDAANEESDTKARKEEENEPEKVDDGGVDSDVDADTEASLLMDQPPPSDLSQSALSDNNLLKCSDSHPELCDSIMQGYQTYIHSVLRTIQKQRAKTLQRAKNPFDIFPNPRPPDPKTVMVKDKPMIKISVPLLPILSPLKETFRPKPEWRFMAAPNVNIVGLPKAGTSQLYNVLVSHKHAVAFGPNKEFCLPVWQRLDLYNDLFWYEDLFSKPKTITLYHKNAIQEALYKFHAKVFTSLKDRNITWSPALISNNLHNSQKLLTVNACNAFWAFELAWQYLQPPSANHKYIFTWRDPADWLWAAWNFWHIPMEDHAPVAWEADWHPSWAHPGKHYRSPELFHEIVASDQQTLAGRYLATIRQRTVEYARKLVAMVGRENVLFLKTEDMKPTVVDQPGGLLDQLSMFLKLNRTKFDPSYYMGMANCNANPSSDRKASEKCVSTASNAYPITGGRSMLPETRTLIYLQFWEECKTWREEFGIVYDACLNIIDDTEHIGLPQAADTDATTVKKKKKTIRRDKPAYYNYEIRGAPKE